MIIDTFPFNRDFNALEIRYQELKDSVDLFVSSESTYTHSGLSKELHLTNSTAARKMIGDKLVVLASKNRPLTNNPRTREMLQRQQITKFIKSQNLSPSDLIIHSDCDEIPRSTVVDGLSLSGSPVDVILELDNYANYLNTRDGIWARGRIQSFENFQSVQHMRADLFVHKVSSHRRHQLPFLRLTDFWSSKRFPFNRLPELIKLKDIQVISNGGWHFNNLFEENEIILKIESSSHVEWNTSSVKENAIANYKSGRDIYTGVEHQVIAIDPTFPEYVVDNLKRWNPFIFVPNLRA
jgi:beta-1,4-mannosyl-glycoprotein beta-1,4-N-acetylglucosaminyltransferase